MANLIDKDRPVAFDQYFADALEQESEKVTIRLGTPTEKPRWIELVEKHHYLKNADLVGESLCYVAERAGQWIALLGWSSAAYHLGARERWIGWSDSQRHDRRHLLACNSRFALLSKKGRRPNLASQILSLNLRRLSSDWMAVYGHPIVLAETFVDPKRFRGTCYRAANWIEVGLSKGFGRSRLDFYQLHEQPKSIFLYPLYPKACKDLTDSLPTAALSGFDRPPKKPIYPFKAGQARSLLSAFSKISDPRDRRYCQHRSVASILTIATAAILAGANTLLAIGEFSQALNQNQLRALHARKKRKSGKYIAPSETTIRRLLQSVDPQEMDQVTCQWLKDYESPSDFPALAVDGKCLRSASKAKGENIMLFSALSHHSGLVRQQIKIDKKTNEIPEIKRLLEPLELEGTLVTADALHTQNETARYLVEDKKADYLFTVKANQPNLQDQLYELVPEGDSFFPDIHSNQSRPWTS